MKDKRDIDLMIKTMLENGQEEVPGHIWDSISSRLDAAATPVEPVKVSIPWWRYAVAGLSIAAAITIVAIFGLSYQQDKPINEEDLIAVVEDTKKSDDLIAKIDENEIEADFETKFVKEYKPIKDSKVVVGEGSEKFEEFEEQEEVVETDEEIATESVQAQKAAHVDKSKEAQEAKESIINLQDFDSLFEEDSFELEGAKSKKNKVALSLSGLTGGYLNTNKGVVYSLPMRRFASQLISETGVTENSRRSLYGLPFSAAIGLKVDLGKKWSVGTGLSYTLLTRRFDGTYNNAEEPITIASDIRNSQHYLGIPLNIYYSIVSNKNFDFYANVGGAVEKCVHNHYLVLKDTQYAHTTKVAGVQWSVNLGLGIEYKIVDWVGFYLDPSLKYFFDNDQPRSNRTAQPLNFGVELGLRFHL